MQPIQRRAFIRNAGAAVAATTVAATTAATTITAAGATTAADPTVAAQLQQSPPGNDTNPNPAGDRAAIQQLHHLFVARLNSRQYGDLQALFADASYQVAGAPAYILGDTQHLDTISVAPDRQRATARFHCRARLESALSTSSSSSLIEMARQQGQGVIHRWESGVLENEYVQVASLWKIARVAFRRYNELRNATNSSF